MPDFGAAKTNNFMLAEATILMGPPEDLKVLNPTDHSLGLVKNFQLVSDVGYVELTQGVQNTIVHSTMNKSSLRATFEVYEYTPKNLTYALGMDGSSVTTSSTHTTVASATTGTAVAPDTTLDLTSATGFAANDWIIVQGLEQDEIFVDKIASIASTVATLTHGIPAAISAGGPVRKCNTLSLASSVDQPYLAMVALGTLADGTLVRAEVPKIRITKGFTLHFDTKNYGNMPFEATVYRPVSTDPFYADFRTQAAKLYLG